VSDEFDFDAPDHCTIGVLGEVGHRLFLFYCRQGLTETTVKVEKQQVAVLGLVAEHPGETIAAVSHADPIKAIVAAAAGVPLDLMQRLVVSPCSISAILFTAGGPVVLCVNSTGSLEELAPS